MIKKYKGEHMEHDLIFKGCATALVTPFYEDGRINYKRLEELVEEQIKAGIDALVICGTTGEASALPDEEHVAVVRTAVQTASGRVPIIAGMGSNDTAHGVNLAKAVTAAGADALLNVTPYYNKTTQKGLIRHFEATAAASDLPVILYNVPSRTNLNINPETYYELAKVENIVAIKECNLAQVPRTRQLCGNAYVHYSGEDGLVIPMMSLGAAGVISVVSNILPEVMCTMTHAFLEGRVKEAGDLQIGLADLIGSLFCEVNPIPVKAAMKMMGKSAGPCRMPLAEMEEQNRERLAKSLLDYGVELPAAAEV